jgi:hypothetical protein
MKEVALWVSRKQQDASKNENLSGINVVGINPRNVKNAPICSAQSISSGSPMKSGHASRFILSVCGRKTKIHKSLSHFALLVRNIIGIHKS